ncbi:MAG: glycoside hydrolase family 5 protein [Maricaulis sp.]|uniref:glycoside hydrolase family 5 protein n=2 Tax=Maricaulis sp. TaxID=1486257 RepID=UPI00329884B3
MHMISRTVILGTALLAACEGPADSRVQAAPDPARQSLAVDTPPVARCMNLSGALEAEYEGAWGYTIEFGHIDAIAGAGFDTIRLPVRWSAHLRAGDRIDPAVLARVDAIIDHALSRGLSVIVDVHHFDALMRDPEGRLPQLAAIWQQLAEHYAGYPDTLIFELLNEPTDRVSAAQVNAINAHLLDVVRAVSPERWVILSSARWNNIEGLVQTEVPADDPRVMTTVHYYSPFEFTHQGAPWSNQSRTGIEWGGPADEAELARDFDIVAQYAQTQNVPVLVGEFGVYYEVPEHLRARWVGAVRQASEERGFAWCHWGFATTLRAYNRRTDSWIPEMREALVGDPPD